MGRGGAGAGAIGMVGAGIIPEGGGGATFTVLRPGGGMGAGGSDTGLVEAFGEGGGSGADGS